MRYLILVLPGCIPASFDDKPGGSESTYTDFIDTQCSDGRYDGPVVLVSATVVCEGTDVRFAAETQGLTGDGHVYLQETGNVSGYGQWAENHTFETYMFDECGHSDWLEQELTGGSSIEDWVPDVSSVFRCDQLEDNGYMTFAFAVLDRTGALADCFAFGHDVPGMIDGTHTVVGDLPDFLVQDCREGVEGR